MAERHIIFEGHKAKLRRQGRHGHQGHKENVLSLVCLKSKKTGRSPVYKKLPFYRTSVYEYVFKKVLAHSIDTYNQYRPRAWTDALHSQPASVPVAVADSRPVSSGAFVPAVHTASRYYAP